MLYQVCRYEPKTFKQRQPGNNGNWMWNLKGIEPVLYNLPQVIKANEVFIVEGEKDADTLMDLGLIATTCPMGVKKWKEDYNEPLKGKDIVLIPDNDLEGKEHMAQVAISLNGQINSLKLLELPGLPSNNVGAFADLNGYSIEDARITNSKFEIQKAEKRLLDIKKDTEMTFRELSDWCLGLEDIKVASSYRVIEIRLNNLNSEIGNKTVSEILPLDLENYRAKRERQGKSDSYIDDEIGAGKTVINEAFENRMISIDTLCNFKSVKKVVSSGDNARDRVLTVDEFSRLYNHAEPHLKGILLAAYWTGLRENDVLGLTWDRIDLPNRSIRFTVQHKRTQKPKPGEIYIVNELFEFLTKQENRLREAGEDNHVFRYNGKPIKNFTRSVKTACRRAKIRYGEKVIGGFIFYDLRHTSITDMRRAGVDPLVNRKWHGHSLRGAHRGYHTIDQEDLKEAGMLLHKYRKEQRKRPEILSVDQTVDQVAKNEGEGIAK